MATSGEPVLGYPKLEQFLVNLGCVRPSPNNGGKDTDEKSSEGGEQQSSSALENATSTQGEPGRRLRVKLAMNHWTGAQDLDHRDSVLG